MTMRQPSHPEENVEREITTLVNADVYHKWRTSHVDELELSVWNIDMLKCAIAVSYNDYGPLKTAVRRGVPDIIKHYIWIKANNADVFYMEHPNFYKHSFRSTFGNNVPDTLGDHCPTFCGGILGLELDILGCTGQSSETEGDSQSFAGESHCSSDLGEDHSLFGETTPESSTYSVPGVRRKSSSFSKVSQDSPCLGPAAIPTMHRTANFPVIPPHLKAAGMPSIIHEDHEYGHEPAHEHDWNKLHAEHHAQQQIIRSTIAEIRKSSIYTQPVARDVRKCRQLSDTFLLYKNRFPPPPSHHYKLVKMDTSYQYNHKPTVVKLPQWDQLFSKKLEIEKKRNFKSFSLKLKRLFCCKRAVDANYIRDVHGVRIMCPPFVNKDFNHLESVKCDSKRAKVVENAVVGEPKGETLATLPSRLDTLQPSTGPRYSVYKLSDVTDFSILLAPNGINEVKRLLWCLNSTFGTHVEFLPLVPSLCCLLVVYMAPEAALCVLHCLLRRAVESRGKGYAKTFLFCNREGFVALVRYIMAMAKRFMRKLVSHLHHLGVDLAAWIARAVQYGFSHMLPFDYIVRIYGNLLFEGEEVFCRYALAILKACQPHLMRVKARSEAEHILYRIGLDGDLDVDELTKVAFTFRLKGSADAHEKLKGTPSPYLLSVKIKTFYRPRLSSTSIVLPEHAWEVLWGWMPPGYRILDPILVFSSNTDGSSLIALIKKLQEFQKPSAPALLLIKSSCKTIIGVFCPLVYNTAQNGHYTSQNVALQHDSFVFTMRPTEAVYRWTGSNSHGVVISSDQILVGADHTALILPKTLASGYTAESASYKSPQLCQEQYFDVVVTEFWMLT